MSDLDDFAKWADERGHYVVAKYIENFLAYQKLTQEKTHKALEEKAQRDGD